jgi:hypothetical protein
MRAWGKKTQTKQSTARTDACYQVRREPANAVMRRLAMATISAPESIKRPQTDATERDSARKRAAPSATSSHRPSIDTPGTPAHYSRH